MAPALGPDEDAFTLVATAVERALPLDGTVPATVRLLGDAADVTDDDLFAFLGGRAELFRAEGSASDAWAAIGAAQDGSDTSELVVAADLGRSDAGNEGPIGSAAYWFVTESSVAKPLAKESFAGARGTAMAAMLRGPSAASSPASVDWSGDWDPVPESGPVAGDWDPTAPPSMTVSEGAYVPRPRYLEGRPSRWRFAADRCGACGALTFPLRGRCHACGRTDGLQVERLPVDGGICVAVTVIGKGGQPTEFDAQVEALGPYAVALVDLVPGVRATLAVTDQPSDALRIGDRVGTRLRRLYAVDGAWRYGRKAVPFRTPAASVTPSVAAPAPTAPPATPRTRAGRGRSASRAE